MVVMMVSARPRVREEEEPEPRAFRHDPKSQSACLFVFGEGRQGEGDATGKHLQIP